MIRTKQKGKPSPWASPPSITLSLVFFPRESIIEESTTGAILGQGAWRRKISFDRCPNVTLKHAIIEASLFFASFDY
jgi:hypothetical protein